MVMKFAQSQESYKRKIPYCQFIEIDVFYNDLVC